ncbi:hypothetical protein K1719_041720 [Acacia pycnantha]|nr:hypothetical protein K1719_041720 [Acacia pycnantha]
MEEFLALNRDVFAWSAAEVPGIDPDFCCHRLAIRPGSSPVARKREKGHQIGKQDRTKDVDESLEVGFIARNTIHHMAFQRGNGLKAKWQVEGVHDYTNRIKHAQKTPILCRTSTNL